MHVKIALLAWYGETRNRLEVFSNCRVEQLLTCLALLIFCDELAIAVYNEALMAQS